MTFLTDSGMSLLDLIDLQEISFSKILESIYENTNTSHFKEVLIKLDELFSKTSNELGHNTVRYLLINLREETLLDVLPWSSQYVLSPTLYLSTKCYPFVKKSLYFKFVW